MAEVLELGKGLIIWVAKKGRVVWKTVLQKMRRYLLIYHNVSFILPKQTRNAPVELIGSGGAKSMADWTAKANTISNDLNNIITFNI